MFGKKLLQLFLFFVMSAGSLLYAADPLSYADDAAKTPLLDYFPIIVYSETGGIANMYQFVAGFAQEFSLGGDLWWLGVAIWGYATAFGIYRAFLKYSISMAVKDILFPVVASALLLMPSQTVHIFDGRTATSTDVRIVNGIPWFIAATASASSLFSAYIMNIADDASSAIGTTTNFRYGAQGLGAPEEFALKAIQKARLDSNITTRLNRVTTECLIPNSVDSTFFDYIGQYSGSSGNFNSFEAMRKIGTDNPSMAATIMSNGQDCSTYIANNFSSTVEATESSRLEAEVLGHLNFLEKQNLAALTSSFLGLTDNKAYSDSSSETLSNFIGYLKNYEFNGALAGTLQNARAEALGGGDSIAIVNETTARASMGNLQVSGLGSWRAMGELVPLAHAFLLSIIYGASILMGFVVLAYGFEKGFGVLKEYFIGLVTFEFVKVAFVLANNQVLFHSQENAITLLSGDGATAGVSMHNPASIPYIAQHLEFLANMSGLAGALGLAAMLFIPGIVFGGKVASAMGILGNVGGMVNNKSPQGVVEDIAKEKGRQKDLNNDRMRKELEQAGIHVGANSDVGAVYSEYMAGMDRAATNLANTSMYKDYDDRYKGVQANTLMAGGSIMGVGRESAKYSSAQIVSAGEATGATNFTGQMATAEALMKKDDSGISAYSESSGVNEAYKKGQVTNAEKQIGSVIGAGREGSKHSDAEILGVGEMQGAMALSKDIESFKVNKELGAINSDNTASKTAIAGYHTNALKETGSLLGAGKTYNALVDKEGKQQADNEIAGTAEMETSESLMTGVKKYRKARKENFINKDNTISDLADFTIGEEADTALDQRINKAAAMHMAKSTNSNIYGTNALASELSQALSMNKAIANKGGVYSSVDTDVAMAGLAASEAQAAFASKVKTLGGKGHTLESKADSVDLTARDISATAAMKQADESIGSTKGIKHEFNKNDHKGFQNVAQSSVESQVESGLGAIRGAGGIHSLAWQSGVKSESDANALRASIDQAGGAKSYINLNEYSARKGISGLQGDKQSFDYEFGEKGYAGQKGYAAFKVASFHGGLGQYAQMKGNAEAVADTGSSQIESNTYSTTTAGFKGNALKIAMSGGPKGFIASQVTMAGGQQAAILNEIAGAGGANDYIQNAAYSGFQKGQAATSERLQDVSNKLADINNSTGLTETTSLGARGIENKAIENSIMRLKDSSKREKAASQFDGIFQALGDKAAENTMKEYGITKDDLRDGGKHMSADAYGKFLMNSEKRMEKMEMSVINDRGEMATAMMRNMATKGADGSINWRSDYEAISSFKKQESGQQRNDHLWDSVTAGAKNLAYHEAPGTSATIGTAFEGVAAAVGASVAYDSFKQRFSATGAKAKMNNGGMAMKDADGSWYAIDDEGKYIENDGKRVNADKKLKPSAKAVWDKMGEAKDALIEKLSPASSSTKNESGNGDNSKANNGMNDKAHSGTPSSDMSNSTTNTPTKQEAYRAEQAEKISKAFGHSMPSGGVFDDAVKAAEHAGGGKFGILKSGGAFAGTMLAGMGISSIFSSESQAAEVPVKVTAKPVVAASSDKGILDKATDALGMGALGTALASTVSKTAAKLTPGVGLAYGAVDTANRELKGDHLGAAMSAGIAGASTLPVGGTAVALAITGAQIATDAMGITGGNYSAAQQQQHHADRVAYAESTRHTGTHQNIQSAINSSPVSPQMAQTPVQRAAQENLIAQVVSNQSQSTQLTALDIQQTHQTRQLAQTQADYIKEVSRSMDEMVGSLAELGGFFENFFAKAEGKVNDKS